MRCWILKLLLYSSSALDAPMVFHQEICLNILIYSTNSFYSSQPQLQEYGTTRRESEVQFRLTRVTLEPMLKSMAYISQQLSTPANRVAVINLKVRTLRLQTQSSSYNSRLKSFLTRSIIFFASSNSMNVWFTFHNVQVLIFAYVVFVGPVANLLSW